MAILVVLGSGCSVSIGGESPAEAAVELIEGDFATEYDLTLTDAVCTDPPTEDIGATFTCTAMHDGQRVDFDGVIDGEDHINVSSANVVYPAILEALEGSAADSLNAQGDFGLSADDFDCGREPTVLDDADSLICALTSPDTGEVFDAVITINAIEDGNVDFNVAVAPEPRP